MTKDLEWESRYNHELAQAMIARQNGNEGRARVCARRAAGIVIGEYFQRMKVSIQSPSAYDQLRALQELPDVPLEARQLAGHFLQRVDTKYSLPVEIDLIDEVNRLRAILLE